MQRKIRALLWIESLFLLLCTTNVFSQANSDYLKSLEGEASDLVLDNQTKNSSIDPSKDPIKLFSNGRQGRAILDLTPGLSQEQFEILLKNNYIGSYLFYKRLNLEHKNEVYQFYQNNPDSQKVRDKILKVSKK